MHLNSKCYAYAFTNNSYLILGTDCCSFSNIAHNPRAYICDVSICVQLPSGSCLASARHKPYWPRGDPPALCLSLGRCRLVGVAVSYSLHRWHPSPATAQCGSVSAHLTRVHASEHPVWQPVRTGTGLQDYTWAVSDAVSQLGRQQINTKHDYHHLHKVQCPFVY